MFNAQENPVKADQVFTGKDGKLWIYDKDGVAVWLFSVSEFHIAIAWQTVEQQFVANFVPTTITTGAKPTLSFNEAIVEDNATIKRIMEGIKEGRVPVYDFEGVITIDDDREERVVCRQCVPTGTTNLLDVTPGAIVQRTFEFGLNELPDFVKYINV